MRGVVQVHQGILVGPFGRGVPLIEGPIGLGAGNTRRVSFYQNITRVITTVASRHPDQVTTSVSLRGGRLTVTVRSSLRAKKCCGVAAAFIPIVPVS